MKYNNINIHASSTAIYYHKRNNNHRITFSVLCHQVSFQTNQMKISFAMPNIKVHLTFTFVSLQTFDMPPIFNYRLFCLFNDLIYNWKRLKGTDLFTSRCQKFILILISSSINNVEMSNFEILQKYNFCQFFVSLVMQTL